MLETSIRCAHPDRDTENKAKNKCRVSERAHTVNRLEWIANEEKM